MPENPTIGLDYSHNNKLTLEVSSYNEFTNFLFSSGYKLGRIEAGFDSLKKLESYDVILLSSPNNSNLEEDEIKNIEKYVRNGGNILILSSIGGDYTNRTNLNELTQKFGFEFESDEINDSVNYVYLQKRPLITKLTPHVISDQVKQLVFSSACSLRVLDFIEDEQNIKIEIIANAGLNTWHKIHNGSEWIEEDCPKIPLIIAVEYYKGRVVGFGSLSLFSSLSREYGFYAYDNDLLISNILRWLIEKDTSEKKVLTVSFKRDLYQWAEKKVKDDNWENMSNLINVGINHFRDNYKKVMNDLQIRRLEKEKDYKEKQMKKKELEEKKILDLIPKRKKEDLIEIIKNLEEITGEKYELSIDFDENSPKNQKEKESEKKKT